MADPEISSAYFADRVQGVLLSRLIKSFIDLGMSPQAAEAAASQELEKRALEVATRRNNAALERGEEPGYTGFGGASEDILQRMNRDYYRANPRALVGSQSVSKSDMPEYTGTTYHYVGSDGRPKETVGSIDPIMNRVSGAGQSVQFSRPMTGEDVNVARTTLPIPRGSAEGYGSSLAPAPQAANAPSQSLLERAIRTVSTGQPAAAAPARTDESPNFNVPANYAGDAGVDFDRLNTEPGFSGRSGDMLQQALAVARPAAASVARPAPRPATAPAAAPMPQPVQRPAAQAPAESNWYSRLFQDPYAGKSSQDLFSALQNDPDNKALYFRAAAKQAEERAANRQPEEALARGGSAGGKGHSKDATIMKALEIIHHMLRGR